MVLGFEDFGDGGEEKVKVGVNEGYICRQAKDYRREEEHFGGPDDGKPEEVSGCETAVEGGAEIGVSGFFA